MEVVRINVLTGEEARSASTGEVSCRRGCCDWQSAAQGLGGGNDRLLGGRGFLTGPGLTNAGLIGSFFIAVLSGDWVCTCG